jgi:hypothetical protein
LQHATIYRSSSLTQHFVSAAFCTSSQTCTTHTQQDRAAPEHALPTSLEN